MMAKRNDGYIVVWSSITVTYRPCFYQIFSFFFVHRFLRVVFVNFFSALNNDDDDEASRHTCVTLLEAWEKEAYRGRE